MRACLAVVLSFAVVSSSVPRSWAAGGMEESFFLSDIPVVNIGTNLKGLTERNIPSQITTLTREEIKLSGARTLPEILHLLVPGYALAFDHNEALHGFRGFVTNSNSAITFLVNGMSVNHTYNLGGSSQNMLLDLNHIERLEVVTGPGSVTLGSGALTGVINVVTRDFAAQREDFIDTGLNVGTGDFRDAYARFNFTSGSRVKVSGVISSFEQKGGYSLGEADPGWPFPVKAVGKGKYHDSLPGHSMFVDVGKDSLSLSLFSTKYSYDRYGRDAYNEMQTRGLQIEKEWTWGDGWRFSPRVGVRQVGFRYDTPADIKRNDDYGETGVLMKAVLSREWGRLHFGVGAEWDRNMYGKNPFHNRNLQYTGDRTVLYDQSGNSFPAPEYNIESAQVSADDVGVFGEARFQAAPGHTFITSARYSSLDIYGEKELSPLAAYLGRRGNAWWKAMFTTAFQTPLIHQRNIPPGGFLREWENPDLASQRMYSYEAQAGYVGNRWEAEMAVFLADNRDIITTSSNAPGFNPSRYSFTLVNSDDITTCGFELQGKWGPVIPLHFELSHSLVRISDINIGSGVTQELFSDREGRHLFSYPEDVTRFHVTWKPSGILSLRGDVLWSSGVYRSKLPGALISGGSSSRPESNRSGNRMNVNAGVVLSPSDAWELTLHGFNLLDSRPYEPEAGAFNSAIRPYPMSFKAGVRYRFI